MDCSDARTRRARSLTPPDDVESMSRLDRGGSENTLSRTRADPRRASWPPPAPRSPRPACSHHHRHGKRDTVRRLRAGRVVVLVALVVGLMATPRTPRHTSSSPGSEPRRGDRRRRHGVHRLQCQHPRRRRRQRAAVRAAKGARACASLATIAFPGHGLRQRARQRAPAGAGRRAGRGSPATCRTCTASNLGTSVDGGATFNVRSGSAASSPSAPSCCRAGSSPRQGDDVRTLSGAILRPDGSDAQTQPASRRSARQFQRRDRPGRRRYIRRGRWQARRAFRAPARGSRHRPYPAAWQPLPDIVEGDVPRSPPDGGATRAHAEQRPRIGPPLFVRPLTRTAWTARTSPMGPDKRQPAVRDHGTAHEWSRAGRATCETPATRAVRQLSRRRRLWSTAGHARL